MLRNLGGSIDISLATSVATNRAQVRQACLMGDLSPFFQPYNDTVQRVGEALVAHGAASSVVPQTAATGWIYQSLLQQAGILAYIDLFAFSAIMCFAMVPLSFLFAPVKAGGAVSTGD
jgi:DHA2 family multidrug resistance protein